MVALELFVRNNVNDYFCWPLSGEALHSNHSRTGSCTIYQKDDNMSLYLEKRGNLEGKERKLVKIHCKMFSLTCEGTGALDIGVLPFSHSLNK